MSENRINKRTLVSFDWAMKSILRDKANFDILEGFLSALLGEDITVIDLLESEGNKRHEIDKFNRVDLKARDSKGREIIIEIQHNIEPDYLERMYYGASKAIVDAMSEGYDYRNVKKVISISIVYFDFMKDSYLAKGSMKIDNISNPDKEAVGIKSELFAEYYFIQPKWFDDNIRSSLDEWIYMLKNSEVKEGSNSKNIDKAKEKLEFAKMTREEQNEYAAYNTSVHSAMSVLSAKKAEGREEGEENARLEMAKRMLRNNRPLQYIMEDTGYTEAELDDIKKQLG